MSRAKYHFRPYRLNDEPKRPPRRDSHCHKATPKPAPEPQHNAEGLMALLKGGERLPGEVFTACRAWAKAHEEDIVLLPKGGSALVCGLTTREVLPIAIDQLYGDRLVLKV